VTTLIDENIRVISLFENGKMKPILFSWRGRNYKVLRTVFSYSKNAGREKIFYFSIDTGGAIFELAFNQERFLWKITKIF